MAANDKERLKEVSPDGTVIVVRLNPLSERNIKDILANRHDLQDTDGFIAAARERGIGTLLRNPQNLDMLAKSVLRGQWPDSRREMFEEAGRMLAREPNEEHLAGNPSIADTSPLIEAAGRLSAVQLLSGAAGYTLPDRAVPDGDHPSLAEVDGEAGGRMRDVLGTRLDWQRQSGLSEFGSDEWFELARKMFDLTGDNVFVIGTVGEAPNILLTNNRRSRLHTLGTRVRAAHPVWRICFKFRREGNQTEDEACYMPLPSSED